jgi:protein-tyrosine phosphatase
MGLRLARRVWPGPVRLLFNGNLNAEKLATLAPPAKERIVQNDTLAARIPVHESFLEALFQIGEPLLLAEGQGDSGPAWIHSLGENLALVMEDDSPRLEPRGGQVSPVTQVRVSGNDWSIEREGVYGQEELARLAACFIYFICTGNTCRSPMAAALCKKLLADKLGCSVEDLPARGYVVMSGGVSAERGDPAAFEAQAAVQAMGADLSQHESRPVSPDLLAQADYLIAMTRGHQQALNSLFPDLHLIPRLLCGDVDLEDPIGGDEKTYNNCAQTILHHIQRLLAEVTAP